VDGREQDKRGHSCEQQSKAPLSAVRWPGICFEEQLGAAGHDARAHRPQPAAPAAMAQTRYGLLMRISGK